MNNRSLSWYAEIERSPDVFWDAEHPTRDAVMPWITHSVHPEIAGLIERFGTVRQLEPGEDLIPVGSIVDQLILVKKGVTGRELGSLTKAMAIATPGRFACGNLNFFTQQPCIGHYFALVKSEVVSVPQKLLRQVIAKTPQLGVLFCIQSELCTLSDRLSFGAYSTLSVEDRLKCFMLAWHRNYGHTEKDENGNEWCVMPISIQRKYQAMVINTSRISLDKTLKAWKENGVYQFDGDRMRLSVPFLQNAYDWMVRMEETAPIERPMDFRSWLAVRDERRRQLRLLK